MVKFHVFFLKHCNSIKFILNLIDTSLNILSFFVKGYYINELSILVSTINSFFSLLPATKQEGFIIYGNLYRDVKRCFHKFLYIL